jgi:hypothetical protein
MFKVTVINSNKLGSPFIGKFLTEIEAIDWIDNCSNKSSKPWGELGEFEVEIEDISAQLAQEEINTESLVYLASTDWLIVRELETGVLCPEEIKTMRQLSRENIVR